MKTPTTGPLKPTVRLMIWMGGEWKETDTTCATIAEALTTLERWTSLLGDWTPTRYAVQETNAYGYKQAIREYGKGMAT